MSPFRLGPLSVAVLLATAGCAEDGLRLSPARIPAAGSAEAELSLTGLAPQAYLDVNGNRLEAVADLGVRIDGVPAEVRRVRGSGLVVRAARRLTVGRHEVVLHARGREHTARPELLVYEGPRDGGADGRAGGGADAAMDAATDAAAEEGTDAARDARADAARDARADAGPSCAPGRARCGGVCVDTSRSLMHCGGCGARCAVPHGSPSCTAGVCTITSCSPMWADCNGDPTDGCEASLRNPSTCGSCDRSCEGGASCERAEGRFECDD